MVGETAGTWTGAGRTGTHPPRAPRVPDLLHRERRGVEFLAVNHSIPDAMAVAITTDAGRVLHTGDFKVDQLPLDGRVTDLNGFARLGDEGVDLLMIDSTNAEVPGFIPSERDIMPVLDSVFAKARGRVIVASFASHVHRIQQIIDMAVEHRTRGRHL